MSSESALHRVNFIVSSDGEVTDDFLEGLLRHRNEDHTLQDHGSDGARSPPRPRAVKLLKQPSSSSFIERKDYLRRSYDTNPYLKKQQAKAARPAVKVGSLAARGRAVVRTVADARASSADGLPRGAAESGFDVQCQVVNRALSLRLAGRKKAIEALENRNRQLIDKVHQLNRQLAQEQERGRSLSSELGRCRASMKKSCAEQAKAPGDDRTGLDLELLKEQLLDFHEAVLGERSKAARAQQRFKTLKSYANQLRADYDDATEAAAANKAVADALAPRVKMLQVANAKLLVDLHTQSLCAAEQEAELVDLRQRLQDSEQQQLDSALDAERLREALRGYRMKASRGWQKEALNSPVREA